MDAKIYTNAIRRSNIFFIFFLSKNMNIIKKIDANLLEKVLNDSNMVNRYNY
jgi:hypothetical protein